VTARADQRPYPPKTANPTPASFPESHGGASPESAAASARRRHDAPSATSDVPSATSNPKDGDGYAWGDAGGPSSLAPSEPPPATLGAILQLIVVKPATATTEPGRIFARKLRRLIAPIALPAGFGPTNRSWLLRYELAGRERWMGLGSEADFTLNNGQVRGPAPHGGASARLPSVEPDPPHTRGEYHAPVQPSSTSHWPQL